MKTPLALATLSLVATSAVMAHPHHGSTEGHSVVHYLTEPLHVGIAVLGVAAILAVGFIIKKRLTKQPATQRQENQRK